MSILQNWSHVVLNVQNANLDKQSIETRIKGLNKRAYKQELDREVAMKQRQLSFQNDVKRKELQQAKVLAEAQKMAKLQSRQIKQRIERNYGEQNEQLIQIQNNLKATSKQMQRKNLKSFLEHPFVKLVDGQDTRTQQLRRKFIKQNEINHLQEEMHNQEKQANRYKEMQEKNDFIDYVERTHEKRSADREKFKNRYLRIRKSELDPEVSTHLKNDDTSVEKMYVSYLNNQMKSNQAKKLNERAQLFEDKRIQQFYSSNNIEPDSSPAFLGRNPLSYERRRQLHFISKHLNTHHERSITSNTQLTSKTDFIPNGLNFGDNTRSNDYLKLARQMNPEDEKTHLTKKMNHPLAATRMNQNHSESVQIKPYITEKHIATENHQTSERSFDERPQIYSNVKSHQNNKSLGDNSRRIKSQLLEESSPQKLPTISRRLLEPHREKTSFQNNKKKQYFRYDVITGKQVAFYA